MDESKMGQPAVDSKEYQKGDYDAKAEELENLNKKDIGSMDEDEAMEVLQKKKQLKVEMKELKGVAEDEAITENSKYDKEALRRNQQETADLANNLKAEDELKISEIKEKLGINGEDNSGEKLNNKKEVDSMGGNFQMASAMLMHLQTAAEKMLDEQKLFAINKNQNFEERKNEIISWYDRAYDSLYKDAPKGSDRVGIKGIDELMHKIRNAKSFSEIKNEIKSISGQKLKEMQGVIDVAGVMAREKKDIKTVASDFLGASNILLSVKNEMKEFSTKFKGNSPYGDFEYGKKYISDRMQEAMKLIFEGEDGNKMSSVSADIPRFYYNIGKFREAKKMSDVKNMTDDFCDNLETVRASFELVGQIANAKSLDSKVSISSFHH